MNEPIATGIEFQPQPDGTVIIEFCDDDGNTLSTQVMSDSLFIQIPLVAFVTLTGMELGPEVAKKLVRLMRAAEEEVEDGNE